MCPVLLLTKADGAPQLSSSIGNKEGGTKDETTSVAEPDCVRSACIDASPWLSCRTPVPEVPNVLTYVEGCVPWEDITVFLNTLYVDDGIPREDFTIFPNPPYVDSLPFQSCTGLPVLKDSILGESSWAQQSCRSAVLPGQDVDEDEISTSSNCFTTSSQSASPNLTITSPTVLGSATSNLLSCMHCPKTFRRPCELT